MLYCMGHELEISADPLFVDQLLVQLKHVELEYLSLLMRAADRILRDSNERSGNDYVFGICESRSSLGFLTRGRSSGAMSSSDCCRIWWNIGGVHGWWVVVLTGGA